LLEDILLSTTHTLIKLLKSLSYSSHSCPIPQFYEPSYTAKFLPPSPQKKPPLQISPRLRCVFALTHLHHTDHYSLCTKVPSSFFFLDLFILPFGFSDDFWSWKSRNWAYRDKGSSQVREPGEKAKYKKIAFLFSGKRKGWDLVHLNNCFMLPFVEKSWKPVTHLRSKVQLTFPGPLQSNYGADLLFSNW
jgi:hypothetical protein